MLRAAGVGQIQPGIESFSDSILALMRKGVTGIQNVQLLKWCREFGVYPHWNVLWGFPGESPGEHERLAELAPKLAHLVPPTAADGIRLDRFSPNFFDADRLGFTDVAPLPAYGHVYRLPPEAVSNLAYYFSFHYADGRDPAAYIGGAVREVDKWKRAHTKSDLFVTHDGAHAIIWDLRPIATEPVIVLHDVARRLYAACDGIATARRLSEELGLTTADVERRLAQLVNRHLVIRSREQYLALAVPLGHYRPAPPVLDQVSRVAKRLGRPWRSGIAIALRQAQDNTDLLVADRARRTRPRGRSRINRSLKALLPSQLTIGKNNELRLRFSSP